MRAEVLALKERLAAYGVRLGGQSPLKKEFLYTRLDLKIPSGALIEVSKWNVVTKEGQVNDYSTVKREIPAQGVSGRFDFVIKFFSEHPKFSVAWVEERFEFYPPVFTENGVELNRVFFVEAKEEVFWCVEQILQSRVFDFLVVHAPEFFRKRRMERTRDLRRLQILAEKSGNSVFLIEPQPTIQGHWPISLQLCIGSSIKVLK